MFFPFINQKKIIGVVNTVVNHVGWDKPILADTVGKVSSICFTQIQLTHQVCIMLHQQLIFLLQRKVTEYIGLTLEHFTGDGIAKVYKFPFLVGKVVHQYDDTQHFHYQKHQEVIVFL